MTDKIGCYISQLRIEMEFFEYRLRELEDLFANGRNSQIARLYDTEIHALGDL